jgi:iron(III) transport system permease protein
MIFCGMIVLVSVVFPISVLSYWLITGIQNGENIQLLFRPAINSLTISIMTASIVAIAVIPIAYLSCRHKTKFSFLVEKICYTGFALPSIAVSISLVFLASKIGSPIYQSMWVLIFGCFVLYLPTGLGSVKSAMLQISPSLEESSRSLGVGSLRTSIQVTIPLLRSGIIAAFFVVFLVTMKELPAVLMLSPLDFRTLTTEIWAYSSEAFFAQAAIPSLTLIIISAIPISLILIKSNSKG